VANVFISYKKEDSASAERIAAALRNQGLSVWWDDHLTARESWDATIEKEIEAAAAVVVLWTARSVTSEWVRTEAHYAAERGKLVPVRLDDCPIPIAFFLRQTIQLSGWEGDDQHRQWRKLLTWILDLVSMHGASATQLQGANAPSNRFRDVLGHLVSGEPIVDGAFINAATPAGTLFRDGERLPVMRVLPKGSFMLGSPPGDADRTAVEGPQRRVNIPEPFAMGVYPVLVEEYRHFIGQLPTPGQRTESPRGLRKFFGSSSARSNATATAFVDSAPVTWISFDDAARFIARLAELSGEKYRVPSESEWEYACRAGTQTRYAFGDTIDTTMAAFGAANGPIPAGKFRPNAFGLYDLHGNVREWTADLWHESYDSTPLDGAPASEGHSSMRVVRGGAWSDEAALLRSSARMRATESGRSNLIGIRVARALSQ
jgi:formylglycine-generating enzyme required for sulfatase activity